MSYVVDLVLLKKLGCHDPWAVLDHFVHPLAVSDGLGALAPAQNRQSLAQMCLVVASHAHEKVHVGERLLGLFELAHMSRLRRIPWLALDVSSEEFPAMNPKATKAGYAPKMEQIENAVCVDPDGSACRRWVRRVAHWVGQLANRRGRHPVLLFLLLLASAIRSGLAPQAAALPVTARGRYAVGNVDARFGGIAGLARVTGAQVGGILLGVVAASLPLIRMLLLQRGAPRRIGLSVAAAGLRGRVGFRGGGVPFFGRGIAGLGLERVDLHGFVIGGGVGLGGRRSGSGGGGGGGTSLAFVAAGAGR